MAELFDSLGINGRLLLAQAVNFLIILFLLQRFVYPKLLRYIEERRQKIQEGVELQEKGIREAERMKEARHRELEAARKQGEEIMAQETLAAEAKGKEMVTEARSEQERILTTAQADAKRAQQDALQGATAEMGRTALAVAEKILARNITTEDEATIAKEVLQEVEKSHAE